MNKKVKTRDPLYRLKRSTLDRIIMAAKAACTLAALWGIYHTLILSDYAHIKSIEVAGTLRHVTVDAAIAASGVSPGQNIFLIDSFELAQNLKRIPWVAQVNIRRRFPDALIIEVVEYEPFAVLQTAHGGATLASFYYVDGKGKIFGKVREKTALPVITGFDHGQLKAFPSFYQPRIQSTVDFLRKLKASLEPTWRVQEVKYSMANGLGATIVSAESPDRLMEIHFGTGVDYGLWGKWREFLWVMKTQGQFFSKVDLHVKGKIFAL